MCDDLRHLLDLLHGCRAWDETDTEDRTMTKDNERPPAPDGQAATQATREEREDAIAADLDDADDLDTAQTTAPSTPAAAAAFSTSRRVRLRVMFRSSERDNVSTLAFAPPRAATGYPPERAGATTDCSSALDARAGAL